jgi:Sugar (and other) transporter
MEYIVSSHIVCTLQNLGCIGVFHPSFHSIHGMQVFGAIFAHFFTDGFGRRYTFVVAALGFILGIGIMVLSSSYQGLLVGRAWVGLGVGIGLAVRAYRSIALHEPSSSHNFSVECPIYDMYMDIYFYGRQC